ncbi:MAG TPA: hypothetical protein VEH81_03665 [Ktedonobacteraceae bacterium]|nr:hypothetical protein [Ktedonobacteraceae bacterium]
MTADSTQNSSNNDHEVSQVIRVLLANTHALVREGTRRIPPIHSRQ